jgi:hypothetical protein
VNEEPKIKKQSAYLENWYVCNDNLHGDTRDTRGIKTSQPIQSVIKTLPTRTVFAAA